MSTQTSYTPDIELMMKRLFATLSEKDQRRYSAIEAAKLGSGGISAISSLFGLDVKTVRENEPKWGLSSLRYEASVVAGSVMRLWRSQRCGIRPWMQVPVYGLNPYLAQQVRAFVRPAHLTFFGHAPAEHFVHRRLGDRAANGQPVVVPTLVIHQIPVIRFQIPNEASQIHPKREVGLCSNNAKGIIEAL